MLILRREWLSVVLVINSGRCIGCGWCAEMEPLVFAISETMVASVRLPAIPDALQAVVQEAARICPVRAIQVDKL